MYVNTLYPMELFDFQMQDPKLIWILVLAFVIAFFLAFGVGANDVANSFGTSVGSKVLTLRQACILATIFEILGSITMGYKVSSTIRTGMINVEDYNGEQKLLMLGYLAALIGASIWNIMATVFGMPVSGTHSIVGAIIGFAVVAKGWTSVKWQELGTIVASWFISPILSGAISLLLWFIIKYCIINPNDSLRRGLLALPLFYAVTIFVNIFSMIHEGPYFFHDLAWWIAILISFGLGFIVGLIVWFVVVPRLRAQILTELEMNEPKVEAASDTNKNINQIELNQVENGNEKPSKVEHEQLNERYRTESYRAALNNEQGDKKAFETDGVTQQFDASPTIHSFSSRSNDSAKMSIAHIEFDKETGMFEKNTDSSHSNGSEEKIEVGRLFTFLQILTACFGSFAHGGNDVSNAIGPLAAVLMLFKEGEQSGDTPLYILLFGGVGISTGLWIWGRRVIKTMGNDLTKITPSSGFTIEIGAAVTVLLASKIGLPVSSTHCKVGSVIAVGKARGGESSVNWKLFGSISIAWLLTVPLTALLSAGAMFLLKFAL